MAPGSTLGAGIAVNLLVSIVLTTLTSSGCLSF
jgi:hypothetical protein